MRQRRASVLCVWACAILVAPCRAWGEEHLTPAWLKLGVELRGRAESGRTFDSSSTESYYLNRVRVNVGIQPAPMVRFFIQGQDARGHEDLRDTFDIRQAHMDLGRAEQGWLLRVGRQEIAIGDERLVGADGDWDHFGQCFDAVRISFSRSWGQALAFTGFRVQPALRRLNPYDAASRILGLDVQVKTRNNRVLEPYLLWKRGGDTIDLMDRPGHRDVLTPGIRAQGSLPNSLDYNIEMALQRGHVVNDSISAWAGHWEAGWKPLGQDFALRLSLEYNFGSGDKSSADGTHGTFDDLYPAGFNKWGMADPIAWRNIKYPAAAAEVPVTRHWSVSGGYRRYSLASINDGMYPGGDTYLVRNPSASGSYVGSHAFVSTTYSRSEHWRVYSGYGRLFTGPYLRDSGYARALATAYLQVSITF